MELLKELKGRDFLSLADFTPVQLEYLIDFAKFLKQEKKAGKPIDYLKGKTLGMIFQKSSTRTRVSFEAGIYYLGGVGLFLSANDLQIGRGEPIKDTARVLSRYLDGIMIRTYAHSQVEELAEYADIPIINGLTDLLHPVQVLADLQTVIEHKGALKGLNLTYIGDGNNMANSLINGGTKMGMNVVIACPKGYEPDADIVANGYKFAQSSGGSLKITHSPAEGAAGADVLYTDVWASMGQEAEAEEKYQRFKGFCLDEKLLALADKEAIVLHCLPAKRGLEITDGVLESRQSVVFDEAENRLWAQMAIMASVM